MATTILPPAPVLPALDEVDDASDTEPGAAPAAAHDDAAVERSYFRSVAIAWLTGVPVVAVLVALAVLAAGEHGVGAAVGVGVFAGIWVSPLAGVVGIGIWSARHHGPRGEVS